MRSLKIAAPLVAALLLVSFLGLVSPAHAQTQPPTEVTIGAYVINISDFNVGQGTFSADFYLWFSWQGNWTGSSSSAAPLPSDFELMNGFVNKATLIQSNQNLSGGYNYLIYRIQASMTDPVNLQDYPFDHHDLTIEIEDQDHDVTSLVYLPDQESRIDQLVALQGWQLPTSPADVYVVNHFYNTTFGEPGQNYTETYSRFILSIPIERPVLSSVVETFVPIILILIVAMISFLIKPTEFGSRLGLNVTTLLTAVAFQINLTAGIPQFGFLTLADRLMISLYIVLVYSLLMTVSLATIKGERSARAVRRLNEASAIMVPLLMVGLLVLDFLL
ncbi:MAG: hypothetical protein OK456_08925 [Thaumarchaeota archaeon]|nr:hypothetical protein [Nitrososphaerota archaeon]